MCLHPVRMRLYQLNVGIGSQRLGAEVSINLFPVSIWVLFQRLLHCNSHSGFLPLCPSLCPGQHKEMLCCTAWPVTLHCALKGSFRLSSCALKCPDHRNHLKGKLLLLERLLFFPSFTFLRHLSSPCVSCTDTFAGSESFLLILSQMPTTKMLTDISWTRSHHPLVSLTTGSLMVVHSFQPTATLFLESTAEKEDLEDTVQPLGGEWEGVWGAFRKWPLEI